MKNLKEDIQILAFAYDLIPQDIVVEQITNSEVNKNMHGEVRWIQNKFWKPSARFPIDKLEQFNEFQVLINENIQNSALNEGIQKEFNDLINNLKPIYQDEDEFQGIKGIEKLIVDGQQVCFQDCEYKPTKGQVTLISFWRPSYQFIMKSMIYHLEILEAYPEWKDKLDIVGISLDDNSRDFQKAILDQKWENQNIFRIKYGLQMNNAYIKPLCMSQIPYIILLNKENQIVYQGNHVDIILEERIKELITEDPGIYDKKQQNNKQGGEQSKPQNQVILEKEQFKLLKQFTKVELREAIKNLNEREFKINVSATKRNLIQRDGSKITIERTPFKLSYEIDIEIKQKFDFFLKSVWETLPENYRILGQIYENDRESLKNMIFLKNQIDVAHIGVNLVLQHKQINYYFHNNEQINYNSNIKHKNVLKIENLNIDNYKQFCDLLNKNRVQFNQERIQIQICAGDFDQEILKGLKFKENERFESIYLHHKVFEDYETISHKQGQILIIYFWREFHHLEAAIREYIYTYNKNKEQWADNVKLVAVSLNPLDQYMEFIDQLLLYQNGIEYYFPKVECNLYNIKCNHKIPFTAFVNKFGIIKFWPPNKKLKTLINELLAEQELKQMEDKQIVSLCQKNKIELFNFLNSNEMDQFIKDLGTKDPFCFRIQIKQDYSIKGNPTLLFIKYFVRQNKLEKFNIILDKVLSFVPNNSYEIKGQISKTFNVPFPGKECILCKKELNDQIQQYYSPYKNEFFCCECAEYDDKTKKGLNRYKCTDNLIFINAPLNDKSVLVEIDDYKIGKNLKLAPDKQGNQYHNMHCDSGKHKFYNPIKEGPRYIALSAKPEKLSKYLKLNSYIEYCQDCFEILKNKDSGRAINILAEQEYYNMVSDSLFLRILFNLGYHDF